MDIQPIKHICGNCHDEWLTEDEYLNHVCPATSFAPTDPNHLGDTFKEVQLAALKRGLDKIPLDQIDLLNSQVAAIGEVEQQISPTDVPIE